jgi:hypothetical protein
VRIENFNLAFGIINLILGLNSIHEGGVLNEGTIFLFNVDNLTNISKILKYVKDTLIIVV